ncbi:20S proteasome subunit beta 3 [Rhizoctonia solani]|uniref:20S proteasome subunit beta 3 n=1 Tax=Rhizoctonia solani TaxID=456999 RepID=A0A8H7M9E1_9AGAM|nr:20S proteasome subunit beta 3 [Rhizoctonia solani]
MSIMQLNGGSVIAMAGKNCVAIASDLRLGNQALTVACNFEKIFPVTDRLYVGLPGLATDVLTLRERLRFRVNMYTMKEEREIQPKAFAHLVSSTLYERRFGPFFIEPVIAGLTPGPDPKPFIAATDLIGCLTLPDDFVVSGTASDKLFGVAESLWEPDLEPEDLFETISQTLLNAVDRDAYSGWGAIVHVITPDKVITRTLKGLSAGSDVSDTSLQAPNDPIQAPFSGQTGSSTEPISPTSGPEFFELRRRQWLAAQPSTTSDQSSRPAPDSSSHARLEAIVTSPGYEFDDAIWETYLKNVNDRLKAGITLRRPLPLWIVIRVLRAGWMRDGTWYGPSPSPAGPIETSSAMPETPALTPNAFLNEISGGRNNTGDATSGRVYASRRVRTPGWNEAALEVERIMQAVEAETK